VFYDGTGYNKLADAIRDAEKRDRRKPILINTTGANLADITNTPGGIYCSYELNYPHSQAYTITTPLCSADRAGRFRGKFNGKGRTIRLNMNKGTVDSSDNTLYAGLFAAAEDTFQIKNLKLTGSININYKEWGVMVGAVTGSAVYGYGGSIKNIVSNVDIVAFGSAKDKFIGPTASTSQVGGIAGNSGNSVVTNCHTAGRIEGHDDVILTGGIVGSANAGGIIRYCYTTSQVFSLAESASIAGLYMGAEAWAGGISGIRGTISNCIAMCKSTGKEPYGITAKALNTEAPSKFVKPISHQSGMHNFYTAFKMTPEPRGLDEKYDGATITETQFKDILWWVNIAEWSVGSNRKKGNDDYPWIWDSTLQLPTLYFE
jgi:hypothetical protein